MASASLSESFFRNVSAWGRAGELERLCFEEQRSRRNEIVVVRETEG